MYYPEIDYDNVSSWKRWIKRPIPEKSQKTNIIVDTIIDEQYKLNLYLSERGQGAKNSIYGAIYRSGVTDNLKN